jgi:ferritin-like metal-binding protein YciE
VRDIALIGATPQVEHHEAAVYGTMRRWAEIIGKSSDASILQGIEAEEGKSRRTSYTDRWNGKHASSGIICFLEDTYLHRVVAGR